MKKITLLPLLILFLATGCKMANQHNAVEYNDKLVGYTNTIGERFLLIVGDIEQGDFDEAEKKRKASVKDCNDAIKGIKEAGDFKGNSDFKIATLKRVESLKDIITNDVKEMLDILIKMDGTQDLEEILTLNLEMKAVTDEMIKKDSLSDVRFNAAQEKFATEHDITLKENPLQKKIDAIIEENEE
jgi:hypothetical protein